MEKDRRSNYRHLSGGAPSPLPFLLQSIYSVGMWASAISKPEQFDIVLACHDEECDQKSRGIGLDLCEVIRQGNSDINLAAPSHLHPPLLLRPSHFVSLHFHPHLAEWYPSGWPA